MDTLEALTAAAAAVETTAKTTILLVQGITLIATIGHLDPVVTTPTGDHIPDRVTLQARLVSRHHVCQVYPGYPAYLNHFKSNLRDYILSGTSMPKRPSPFFNT